MDKSDFVIIGGVACGCKSAATLARRLPDASITLFQKEKNLSYGTCGLPYFASGDIETLKALMQTGYDVVRDSDFFKKSKNFKAITESEVVLINRDDKTVRVKDLNSGETSEHGYGKLVIATGAKPSKLPLDFPESTRIMPFTRPEHAINFRRMAQSGQVGSALIIGGGFIGCELAEAASSLWGIETSLVEKELHVLPYVLDHEMALPVEKELRDSGVTLRLGTIVHDIEIADEEKVRVSLSDKTSIEADYVFLCTGVTPESSLARDAGLKIGMSGGIKVNEFMQTSDADIYAGGDAVELIHQLTGKPIYIPMGSIANRHGRIIGEHASGGNESFPGVLGAFMVKVFEMNVGSVGLSQTSAEKAGFDVITAWGSFVDKPDYYPEFKSFSVKMIVNRKDKSLLGLQAVGKGDVVRRVDVFSAFLQNKCKIDDLLNFEHGYAPPYAEALDPLYNLAATIKSIENGFTQTGPDGNFKTDDIVVLDVREPDEVESKPFKANKLVHIPLNDLADNLEKLDKNSKIVVLCHRGPRSYQASVILKNAGFLDVSYIAGGMTLAVKSLA
jgi:NADPH-dependent 2,4-dienoyl-CoA reductase/sulfur reductase-like enzyme/rhodanese-related sulfurtransferase